MLGAAVVGEVIALDNELPKKLNDPHARSKELAEEPFLRRPGTDATFRSVLDVPGYGREVGQLVDNVVNDVNHTLVGVVMVGVRHAGGGGNGGQRTWGGCGEWLVPFIWERGGRVVSCAHAWVRTPWTDSCNTAVRLHSSFNHAMESVPT